MTHYPQHLLRPDLTQGLPTGTSLETVLGFFATNRTYPSNVMTKMSTTDLQLLSSICMGKNGNNYTFIVDRYHSSNFHAKCHKMIKKIVTQGKIEILRLDAEFLYFAGCEFRNKPGAADKVKYLHLLNFCLKPARLPNLLLFRNLEFLRIRGYTSGISCQKILQIFDNTPNLIYLELGTDCMQDSNTELWQKFINHPLLPKLKYIDFQEIMSYLASSRHYGKLISNLAQVFKNSNCLKYLAFTTTLFSRTIWQACVENQNIVTVEIRYADCMSDEAFINYHIRSLTIVEVGGNYQDALVKILAVMQGLEYFCVENYNCLSASIDVELMSALLQHTKLKVVDMANSRLTPEALALMKAESFISWRAFCFKISNRDFCDLLSIMPNVLFGHIEPRGKKCKKGKTSDNQDTAADDVSMSDILEKRRSNFKNHNGLKSKACAVFSQNSDTIPDDIPAELQEMIQHYRLNPNLDICALIHKYG